MLACLLYPTILCVPCLDTCICKFFLSKQTKDVVSKETPEEDLILTPPELADHFVPKKLPRGVSVNSLVTFCFQDQGKGKKSFKDRKIGDRFATVKDSDLRKWKVHLHDGTTENVSPAKMALALQVRIACFAFFF